MSLRVVTGGAGTGKTTRLLALVDEWLSNNSLREGQKVLALTFMHGSRIRLTERLHASKARGRFECVTFDGFARELCLRWRSRVSSMGAAIPAPDDISFFDITCEVAAALMDDLMIVQWVAAAHPLIVVDEFQDCYGARPKLVERLSGVADVLVAADPFQDLRGTEANPALDMIARTQIQPEELTVVHRTNVSALLSAASALRAGRPCSPGPGLEIVGVKAVGLAAYHVCRVIAASKAASPVVISAGRPDAKSFSRKVLNAVESTAGFGKYKSLGPYRVPWESSPEAYRDELIAALALDEEVTSAESISRALPTANPLARGISGWLERERRLRGRTAFSETEIRFQVRQAEAHYRALPRQSDGRRALTIPQAKNREFRRVIVLWGFSVPSNEEMQRRWLYNAITRAKEAASIIVFDPSGERLRKPPFALV